MVETFQDKYGKHSLDDFGSASYQGSLTSIMFDYWRSFLTVRHLVEEKANHNIKQVFNDYHHWHNEGRKQPLMDYFDVGKLFDEVLDDVNG